MQETEAGEFNRDVTIIADNGEEFTITVTGTAIDPNPNFNLNIFNDNNNLGGVAVGSTNTNDAAVLEFDFVPEQDKVSFQYVFASEEYNEYVGSFNNVFAFFLDGENIALIPETTTPVSIHNVNNDNNSEFYNDNNPSDLGTPTPFSIEYDGFTVVLTAVANVEAGVPHHIKLAVADTSDSILDSAVFLAASSFVGN